MSSPGAPALAQDLPSAGAVLELLKPITWFPPMWAFGCGAISAGTPLAGRWIAIIAGVVLCGPLLCATSQVVNDWFDREVDALNEPHRPIPSGRIPGCWGLYLAVLWSIASWLAAAALGRWVLIAATIGLALAWAYSAPPIRLKRNGWWGNLACALCYEGLAWITGAALLSGSATPGEGTLVIAALYSLGAHGIMTLNDFKSIDGDRRMGIGSLPVRLGPARAAVVACWAMALPQVAVVALLAVWGRPYFAALVCAALVVQLGLMRRLVASPRERAPWYNATGVSLYVLGMLAAALALRGVGA